MKKSKNTSMNSGFFIIKKQIKDFAARKNAFCNNLTYLLSKTVAFGLVFLRKTLYTVVIGNPGLHLNLSKAFSLWFFSPSSWTCKRPKYTDKGL